MRRGEGQQSSHAHNARTVHFASLSACLAGTRGSREKKQEKNTKIDLSHHSNTGEQKEGPFAAAGVKIRGTTQIGEAPEAAASPGEKKKTKRLSLLDLQQWSLQGLTRAWEKVGGCCRRLCGREGTGGGGMLKWVPTHSTMACWKETPAQFARPALVQCCQGRRRSRVSFGKAQIISVCEQLAGIIPKIRCRDAATVGTLMQLNKRVIRFWFPSHRGVEGEEKEEKNQGGEVDDRVAKRGGKKLSSYK